MAQPHDTDAIIHVASNTDAPRSLQEHHEPVFPIILNLEDFVDKRTNSRYNSGLYWQEVARRTPAIVADRFDKEEAYSIVRRTAPQLWRQGVPWRAWPGCHSGWSSFMAFKFSRLATWMGIHMSSKKKVGCFANWREAAEHHKTKPAIPSHAEFWAMFIIGNRTPRDRNQIRHFEWSKNLLRFIKKLQLRRFLPQYPDVLQGVPEAEADDTFWDGYSGEAFARHMDIRRRVPATKIITRSKFANQLKPDSLPPSDRPQ